MVTLNRLTTLYKGISNDTKPTDGVRNGSRYFEMDTSRLYIYNEAGNQWEIFSSGTDVTAALVGIGAVGYMII